MDAASSRRGSGGGRPPPPLDALADTTARYPFKVWGFGESIAIEALLAKGGEHRTFAAHLLERWAHQAPPLGDDPLAHVAPGLPMLVLFEATGDAALLARGGQLAEVLAATRRGAHGARIHRPDLAGWEHEVWVDCMHLDAPFLARLGALSGESGLADLAAELLLSHARVLQSERIGLFSHGFDDATGRANGVHWGRGQGWALLGLVDAAQALPPEHPARPEIEERLGALVAALATTEVEAGRWHTVADHPETYLEPSVSAFVALGVGRAVRHALVPSDYQAMADRAWGATVAGITPQGALAGVSDATPVGYDAAHYGARGRGVFPWGQGPALLAGIERMREAGWERDR